MTTQVPTKWRQELYFKGQTQLQNVAKFLKANNIKQINLTNKQKEDDLIGWVRTLKQNIEDLDVCVHYSIKWNYKGALQPSFARFVSFCQELKCFSNCSILLLSGTGAKKRFNSLEALKMMKSEGVKAEVPLYVAFNPYLPGDEELQVEKDRLVQKIQTGLISGIYLQTGSDLLKLREGLEFATKIIRETNKNLQITGSIFVADGRFLSQMKFRPWNGVFLSQQYLSCVENAHAITAEVLEVYRQYSIVPIIETPVKNESDLRQVKHLLQSYANV